MSLEPLSKAALRLCGDFVAVGPGFRTGKCELLRGVTQAGPVFAKRLIETGTLWQRLFAREIENYELFELTPPPVRVPRLVAADPTQKLLIIEAVDGLPLATDRYPASEPARNHLLSVIATADVLGRWRKAPGSTREQERGDVTLPGEPDVTEWYVDRIRRAAGEGDFLPPREADALLAVARQGGVIGEFAHGDLLLTNVLAGPEIVLIDWEYGGEFIAGWDLAVLWTICQDHSSARSLIEEHVAAWPVERRQGFLLNQAVAVEREIRIHRRAEHDAPSVWRTSQTLASGLGCPAFCHSETLTASSRLACAASDGNRAAHAENTATAARGAATS